MSVVETGAGVADGAVAVLPQADARRLTDQIRLGLDTVWELAVRAWQGRAWQALGYASWDEYCTRELGNCQVPLPRDVQSRAAAWAPMAQAGMSAAAIASVAGTSRKPVRNALRTDQVVVAAVTGVDGVARPAVKPTRSDVLIRQANAARLRREGLTQGQIAAELGVAQATVSVDLAQIDKMAAELDQDVDVATVLQDARDEAGRTDAAVVADRLGVQAAPARHLVRLVRQPARDLEATLRVVVKEVVLADEWLDTDERAAALEVLMPATARVLEQIGQIVAALRPADRQGPRWQALAEAIADLDQTRAQA